MPWSRVALARTRCVAYTFFRSGQIIPWLAFCGAKATTTRRRVEEVLHRFGGLGKRVDMGLAMTPLSPSNPNGRMLRGINSTPDHGWRKPRRLTRSPLLIGRPVRPLALVPYCSAVLAVRAGTRTKLARAKASNLLGPIYSFGGFPIADIASLG